VTLATSRNGMTRQIKPKPSQNKHRTHGSDLGRYWVGEQTASRIYVVGVEPLLILWCAQTDSNCRPSGFRSGVTPGVLWELNAAVQRSSPEKLLIAFPSSGTVEREELYSKFRRATVHILPRQLPVFVGNVRFIIFDRDWRPQLLTEEKSTGMRPRSATRASLRPFLERFGRPLRRRWRIIEPETVEIAAILVILYWTLFYSGPNWRPYHETGFSVSLPSAPQESQDTLSTPFGPITEHRVKARWRGAEYSVTSVRVPNWQMTEPVVETLNRARDEMIAKINGRLLRETPLEFGASSGRDLVIEANGKKIFVKCRMLRSKDRLITAVAMLPSNREYPLKNSVYVQTFFDSLKAVDEI
jgi:hypothetical protein